jgi:hypothetical protein
MPPVAASSKPASSRARKPGRPFFGMIDAVIVEDVGEFEFDGAVSRKHAMAAWTWIFRDLAPELIDPEADASDPATLKALDTLMPELLNRTRDTLAAIGKNRDAERRLKTQLGGEDEYRRLPFVLSALRCRHLIEKAQNFGRAANGMNDEGALAAAIQAMPLSDPLVFALLMQAAVGQIANPTKLSTAAIRIAGANTEISVQRAGLGPLVDAMLAHAQNQIQPVSQSGVFADVDLICRSIDRFHRLVRAVNGYIEIGRGSRWAAIAGAATKAVSERIEPRVRDVVMDVNRALRRYREGADRLDSDQLLSALNSMYVLATVRDCRDSLALNAVFDPAWTQVGQALEIHIQRNLDMLRMNPADRITGERLDAAIKMAELRFNVEYADVLRRARDVITGVKPASPPPAA